MKKCLLILMGFLLLAKSYAQEDTTATTAVVAPVLFHIQAVDNVVVLKWSFEYTEDLKSFDVERSEDGIRFTKIGSRLAISKSANEDYDFVDATPKRNVSLSYRLKLISKDGFVSYSNPKEVRTVAEQLTVRLKQNPVRSDVDMEVTVFASKQVSVAIVSPAGQQVLSQKFQLSAGVNQLSLSTQTLYQGFYRLIVDVGTDRKTLSFIKE